MWTGELHDVTLRAARDDVRHDSKELRTIIKAGKPMIVFHNHPADGGRAAMFPSHDDFGVAALVSFMAYAEDPTLPVDFRIVQLGEEEDTVISYGFKGTALEDIKEAAREYRSAAARQILSSITTPPRRRYRSTSAVCVSGESGRHPLTDVCRTHPEDLLLGRAPAGFSSTIARNNFLARP